MGTLSYYLLNVMFCLCFAEVKWRVEEKISGYGENLLLLCTADTYFNDTTKIKRWQGGSKKKMLILNGAPDQDDANKYGMITQSNGFLLIIRNVTKEDLDVFYECTYGFETSGKVILKQTDVFQGSYNNQTESQNFGMFGTTMTMSGTHMEQGNRKMDENNIAIICTIAALSTLVVFSLTLVIYFLHRKGLLYKMRKSWINFKKAIAENISGMLIHQGIFKGNGVPYKPIAPTAKSPGTATDTPTNQSDLKAVNPKAKQIMNQTSSQLIVIPNNDPVSTNGTHVDAGS